MTALLGAVSPSLRRVAVDWTDKAIKITSYFDGEISEKDKESMSCVEGEVLADFSDYDVRLDIIRQDAPSTFSEGCL